MLKRLFPFRSDKPPAELLRLRREIETTKTNLELAMANFDQAVDPTLIDCYIYEVNAEQLRYQFLLQQAKQYDDAFPQYTADLNSLIGRMDRNVTKG